MLAESLYSAGSKTRIHKTYQKALDGAALHGPVREKPSSYVKEDAVILPPQKKRAAENAMKHLLSPLALLCTMAFLQGCAVWGTIADERLVDTMASDKAIATIIKKDLMAEKVIDGWNINVYCYYGHVFLVGEAPDAMRSKAIAFARKDNRVRSVTPHWFKSEKSGESDIMVATRLRTNLIGTSNLSSTRIDTEVNAGRVVLLGVVSSAKEKSLAIKTTRTTKGVRSVTSYLMLPPKPGQADSCPSGETYPGQQSGSALDPPADVPDTTPVSNPTQNSGSDIKGHDI